MGSVNDDSLGKNLDQRSKSNLILKYTSNHYPPKFNVNKEYDLMISNSK